jgi:erythromycin esterase-like protein
MKRMQSSGVRWFAFTFLLLTAALAPASTGDEQASLQWLRMHAIPIQTVEAGHGFADMQPLNKVVGDARVVELGEATHGTREFFQMKHRMVEFLASQKGFTIFSIEANMPEAYRLNDYVLNGVGDPKELLKGMYFWTWNTEEVLDMILWMREFNKAGKGRIEFTGFDMQYSAVSAEIVRKFVMSMDRPYYDATLNGLYNDVSAASPQQQAAFGVATANFPAQAALGKHVTLAGYIRSKDVAGGYAGLWVRADGPQGPLAFGDMHEPGVVGKSDWTRYEVSIAVPANATKIYFGVLNTGSGSAWFDSLKIEIGGVPYTDDAAFDLGFESSAPRGFYTGGEGYEVTVDSAVAQSGKQSLRIKRLPPPPSSASAISAGGSQVDNCSAVVDYLEANRSRYIEAGTTPKDLDWVIQNARLVLEYAQLKAGTQTRDHSMADNVKWIADHNPDAKIVIWAHNGHISNTGYGGISSMGSYLRKMFGSQLVNFGFAFNQGSFQAMEMGKSLHPFTVDPAPEGTLDRTLAAVGIPVFAVDLRQLPKGGPVAQWFAQAHPSRSIGAAYSDSLAPSLWSPGPAKDDFDVLLFVEKTAAAHPNP